MQETWAALWRAVDEMLDHLPSDEEPELSAAFEPGIDLNLAMSGEIFEDPPPYEEDSFRDEDSERAFDEEYFYSRVVGAMSQKVRFYAERRHLPKLHEYWTELSVHLDSLKVSAVPAALREQVTELLQEMHAAAPALIYESDEKASKPKLIIEVSRELALRAAREPKLLYRLSPRAFEELMAEIMEGFGYEVELTAATRDGGADLIALKSEHGVLTKLLVECKRWLPPNKVGVGLVEQLYGVKTRRRATKALLVTTSYFSRPARALEQQHLYELQLKDFDALQRWLQEYSILTR